MSIEVQSLSKVYGTQEALSKVSFTIKKGEIVGFLGPNGAGKSTMMKILTGYIPQSSGDAQVCGLDVVEESMAVRRKVGYLPENNPLYLEMYVVEYLRFMAGLNRSGQDKVQEIIDRVGLRPESHKRLGQLSKGFRQRAGLAAALLHDPEVLILDEPTTGLDPNQIVEIRKLIKEAGREKTVMLSTHIMQEVEILCDRVIIINKGEIVADRSTSDLQKLHQEAIYRIEFDKAVEASDLEEIEGIKQAKNLGEQKVWQLHAQVDAPVRNAIFKWAVAEDRAVLEMREEEQKLEQIFQRLTQQSQSA